MTAMMQRDMSFLDQAKGMVSYAHSFGAKFHVSFSDVQINDIVHDMNSSEFFIRLLVHVFSLHSCDKACVEAKHRSSIF